MKYTSAQLLEDLYAQTEANINKAISNWQFLSNKQMTAQPAPGAWSASQCLAHLNSYGRYYLPAIEKAMAAVHTTPAAHYTAGWLGNYFYNIMLPQGNGRPKKKMRSPKNHQPGLELNAARVVQEFIGQLEVLGRLLSEAQKTDLNRVRVPVSIAPFIKLKLGDTFLFLTAHINRHMRQAERALEAAAGNIAKAAPAA